MSKTTVAQATLRQAWRFFHANAGGVVGQAAVGAWRLANAERMAQTLGAQVQWEPEQDVDDSWMDDAERAREHSVECAVLVQPCDGCGKPRALASLGNIFDADASYRRVVEAELALEHFAQVSK